MVKLAAAMGILLAAPLPAWDASPETPPALPTSSSPTASSSSPTAGSASPTASRDLPMLPPRPLPAEHQKNIGWEDFTVVTVISAPFTALWCGLGAAVVSAFSRGRLPLSTSSPLFGAAAGTAALASVTIGLVSVNWGGSSGPAPLSSTSQVLLSPGPLSATAR